MVERLGAQNAVLLAEVQRTQAAREEAVETARALLSEHRTQVEHDYQEMRAQVQRDAIEIFERVQAAVSAELGANVSSELRLQEARHVEEMATLKARRHNIKIKDY